MFSSFAFCFASKIDDDDALDDGEAPAGAYSQLRGTRKRGHKKIRLAAARRLRKLG